MRNVSDKLDQNDASGFRPMCDGSDGSPPKDLGSERDRSTEELRAKNAELMMALHDAHQKLLAQERLASLGTLMAGIAHEIKNPLNFIINFAELSRGLLADLTENVAD